MSMKEWFWDQVKKIAIESVKSYNTKFMEKIYEIASNVVRSVQEASNETYDSIWLPTEWAPIDLDNAIIFILLWNFRDVQEQSHLVREAWKWHCQSYKKLLGQFQGQNKSRFLEPHYKVRVNLWLVHNTKHSMKHFQESEELLDPKNWYENLQTYKFFCKKIQHFIVAPKNML